MQPLHWARPEEHAGAVRRGTPLFQIVWRSGEVKSRARGTITEITEWEMGTPPLLEAFLGCAAAQRVCWNLLGHHLQELNREEMVADIASAVRQPPVGVSLLCSLQADLTVLHHLVDAIHTAHHPNRLCGVRLLHHLQPRDGGLLQGGRKHQHYSNSRLQTTLQDWCTLTLQHLRSTGSAGCTE